MPASPNWNLGDYVPRRLLLQRVNNFASLNLHDMSVSSAMQTGRCDESSHVRANVP